MRKPYDVVITYADGSTGELHFWALNMRDALENAVYWLVLPQPAHMLTITERMP